MANTDVTAGVVILVGVVVDKVELVVVSGEDMDERSRS